jgi:hypothetical protein
LDIFGVVVTVIIYPMDYFGVIDWMDYLLELKLLEDDLLRDDDQADDRAQVGGDIDCRGTLSL